MNGTKFVQLLQNLEVPGAEKLIPTDYDWIFLQNENLSKFWQWIIENFGKADLLTDKELEDYNKLVEKGLTLSSEQLKQMEAHLCPLTNSSENIWTRLTTDEESKEERGKIREEVKLIQQRTDRVLLQKMETKDRIERRKENIKRLERTLELENRKLYPALTELSRSKKDLFTSLRETVETFENFTNSTSNVGYVCQQSLSQWQEEEEKFQIALKKYVDRQFAEDVQADPGDSSIEPLVNTDSLNSAKHKTFVKDSKELNRITKMLEQATVNEAVANIEKQRKESELEEASKVLKMISDKGFPSSQTLLMENIKESEEINKALAQDLSCYMEGIREKASTIAETERTNVLLSNYKEKNEKQEHFLNKQKQIIEEFAGQLSRYDAFKIIFDIEKKKISENFELFLKMGSYLCSEEKSLSKGETALHDILRQWKDDKDLRSRKELSLIDTLSPSGGEESKSQNSIEGVQKEYLHVQESKLNSVQNVFKVCSMMKNSLFGSDKLPTSLPPSWLSSDMFEEQQRLKHDSSSLQEEMVHVVKDIALKKTQKICSLKH